ncbi:MAG: hypothetical protein JWN03_8559 [Nocardia sp.]|nr:hypothetical protein [Nocardia sp.]
MTALLEHRVNQYASLRQPFSCEREHAPISPPALDGSFSQIELF